MRHSYSSYAIHKKCGAAWKYRYIDGLPDLLPKPAAERGTRLHKAAERFLLGELAQEQLPVQFRAFTDQLLKMREEGASPEAVWVTDDLWRDCPDGSPEAWLKSIIDVHWIEGDTLYIRDFKSGQMYPGHSEQLELYMVVGAALFPGVENVVAEAMYLDHGCSGTRIEHNRLWLTELRRLWKERFDEIENDTRHEPRPSRGCRWCPYAFSNNGPCRSDPAAQAATAVGAFGKESGE